MIEEFKEKYEVIWSVWLQVGIVGEEKPELVWPILNTMLLVENDYLLENPRTDVESNL